MNSAPHISLERVMGKVFPAQGVGCEGSFDGDPCSLRHEVWGWGEMAGGVLLALSIR